MPRSHPRARAVRVLRRSTGRLATDAMARMEADMAWFRHLPAEDRSWVGVIVQAGIRGFVEWYAAGPDTPVTGPDLAASVYGAAPRALAGVITLQQTVDLVRLSIAVVEENLDHLLEPADAPDVHAAVSRYAREVAFATAEVYARAAEQRGAWDARLEALVVDAVLRGETDEAILSRAGALGWDSRGAVAVVLGNAPARRSEATVIDAVRRAARSAGLDVLCGVQGHRLVVLLAGAGDPRAAASAVSGLFGPGPVIAGPLADGLPQAHLAARSAVAAAKVAAAWPGAPRPALSSELLPERALAGDATARAHLVEEVYRPLLEARGTLIETLTAYFSTGGSIEGTARELFVHPNTVRYRLRQAADLTGFSPGSPRDAFTLQIALALGRLDDVDRGAESALDTPADNVGDL